MLFLLAVGTLICIDLLRNGNSWNIYGEMFNHHHSILFFSQQQTSYLDLFYRPVKMKKIQILLIKLVLLVASALFYVNSFRNDNLLNIFREMSNHHPPTPSKVGYFWPNLEFDFFAYIFPAIYGVCGNNMGSLIR